MPRSSGRRPPERRMRRENGAHVLPWIGQNKHADGNFARFFAFALILSFMFVASASAAILIPASPDAAGRIDYQTVVIRPSSDSTKARITIFCALRLHDNSGSEQSTASLLIPLDGMPQSAVTAQALTLNRFDRTVTHATDLEGAFYDQAQKAQRGQASLYTAIGASGGLPSWLLLASRWPPKAPPLTAVLHSLATQEAELPVIETIRILPAEEYFPKISERLDPDTTAALSPFGEENVIVVDFIAPSESETSFQQSAVTGIRVTYELPLPQGESPPRSLRLPIFTDREKPALTRLYTVSHWNQATFVEGLSPDDDAPSAQKIADDVAAVFGRDDASRRSRLWDMACVQRASTRTANGGLTQRTLVCYKNPTDVRFRVEDSHAGALRVTGVAAGTFLYTLLWPLTAVVYLATLWLVMRVYLWLVSAPMPPRWWRLYASLILLGPLLTPWFLLRYLRSRPLNDDGDRSGSLGALSLETYDCIARLVAWGLVVCVTWAVVQTLVKLAAHLRFG